MVTFLLNAGASLDERGLRASALHRAIEGLHQSHADLVYDFDLTPHAHVEVALRLIEAGADLNATDEFGGTPLFNACMQQDTEAIVTALIARGANPYQRMRDGRSAWELTEDVPDRRAPLALSSHRKKGESGWAPPSKANSSAA